jgi:hypothetical protein
MNMRILAMTAILGVGLAVSARAAQMTIAADRMTVVDGQRVFVLGLYETPKEDAVLQQAAKAGFNLVHAGPSVEMLDRLQAQGLWGWVNTGMDIDLSVDPVQRKNALAESVNKLGLHPALLVWEVPDEALWNCWYGPLCWRFDAEPAQLNTHIAALTDATQAQQLREQLAQARALYKEARYAEGERLADDIWVRLGKTPPNPGYGLSTSAERAAKMCAGMLEGRAALRALDPSHPVWMNHAPRNQVAQLAAFNGAADIVGCDIYPVPFAPEVQHSDLAEKTVASAGAYTTRMQEAAPGKPVWMVLQGFGWGDIQPERTEAQRKALRRPTLAESRFMAYDAIVRGARGILYWGTAYIEKDSQLWNDLLALIAELRGLQPVLSAPDAELPLSVTFAETMGSVDRGVQVLPKSVQDKTWLLVVNEWTDTLVYTIHGLESLEGKKFVEAQSGAKAAVKDGTLCLNIPAQAVQVLQPE